MKDVIPSDLPHWSGVATNRLPIYLRLDVDHACFNRVLSYFHLLTGLPVPHYLNHVYETKRFLSNYGIRRIWMFRPRTCPESWDEPFGLHATYSEPEKFERELSAIERNLGSVKHFSRHGFARFASGHAWTEEEIKRIEEQFGLVDISAEPHITISRLSNSKIELGDVKHILLHPVYIRKHRRRLAHILSDWRRE